jgi:hypothetical protein
MWDPGTILWDVQVNDISYMLLALDISPLPHGCSKSIVGQKPNGHMEHRIRKVGLLSLFFLIKKMRVRFSKFMVS